MNQWSTHQLENRSVGKRCSQNELLLLSEMSVTLKPKHIEVDVYAAQVEESCYTF